MSTPAPRNRSKNKSLTCIAGGPRAGRDETYHKLSVARQRDQTFESAELTPAIVDISSPASKNICRLSLWETPLCFRTSMAFTMISYSCFVARAFETIAGLGNHGNSTVAGVVPRSTFAKSCLRRATISGSSAISVHVRHRTVA